MARHLPHLNSESLKNYPKIPYMIAPIIEQEFMKQGEHSKVYRN